MTARRSPDVPTLRNFIDGNWVAAAGATGTVDVHNPAQGCVIARTPLSGSADLDAAVAAAQRAFGGWRETPVVVRARAMFRFKEAIESHLEELARLVTAENGKTLDESRGSVRRGIECVEAACGAPSLMMGMALDNVASGLDCTAVREPLGVVAAIAPFNFPVMVPLWFLPFAVVTGNTFVLKPSPQVPLTAQRVFELLAGCDLPPGVVNLVHGSGETAEMICEHPAIRAVSFVGSTPVAREIYRRATSAGKRVQALGGAKNFTIVMPDADFDRAIPAIVESFFGCAGQRCLAGSVLLPVGPAHEPVRDRMIEAARALRLGDGSQDGVTMGPVISARSRSAILGYIQRGEQEGGRLVLDGREATVPDRPNGFFLGATIFDDVNLRSAIGFDEIFGPVASVHAVRTLDEALEAMHTHPKANATSIFTSSGRTAREFARRASPSMVGINIGVAAPVSWFPFGGTRDSFFGDMKAHGRDAFDFYTDRKVVISRWF